MPVGELGTTGCVTTKPCAAPLQAGADGKAAVAGVHDAPELRHRRHAAAPDASAKRCRYEPCSSCVAASDSEAEAEGGRESPVAPGSVSRS